LSRVNNTTVYFYSLFREIITSKPIFFILVSTSFDWTHGLRAEFGAEILDFKFYAAKLDYIALL
jgi:hypothetical protein